MREDEKKIKSMRNTNGFILSVVGQERSRERKGRGKESLELNKLNKKACLFPVLLSINLWEIEKKI